MNIENFRYVAHRGLCNKTDIPENSIKAFEAAAEKGYAIELDLNLTKDGYIVVFHDDNLKRVTGIKGDITTFELKELKQLKLLGTENKIPTFEDVLMCINGRVGLMIEIKKTPRYKELMEKLVKMLDKYEGDYVIKSFDPRVVYWLKKNAPHIVRGQLSGKNVKEIKGRIMKILLGNMVFNVFTKPNFISYQYLDVDEKFYNKQRKKNRYVAVWTIRNKEELEKVKNSCDMIIFENEETVK